MSAELRKDESTLVTWGPVAALSVTIGTYFLAQLLSGLVILGYSLSQRWTDQQLSDWLNQSVVGQFVLVLLVSGITLAILALFLRRRKSNWSAIGLIKPKLMDPVYALVGFGMYFPLVIVVTAVVSGLIPSLDTQQQQEVGFQTATAAPELALVFISLVVVPPLVEEIVMRGFLYTGLRTRLPTGAAVLITSALFGIAHLQFGSDAPLLWIAFVDTFVLSVVLIAVREIGDSLWPAIFLHAIKNGIAFASLFVFRLV